MSYHQEESRRHHSSHTTADGQTATRRPQPAADAGVADEMAEAAADHEGDQNYRRRTARRRQQTVLKASPLTTRLHVNHLKLYAIIAPATNNKKITTC